MIHMHSDRINAQISAWPAEPEEDRLDRLHVGDGFLGLAARLNLDGTYALIVHGGTPDPSWIPLTEPGPSTLCHRDLALVHEVLSTRAKAYGEAEDGQSRVRVLAFSQMDMQSKIEEFVTVTDVTSDILCAEQPEDFFVESIPTGMSEREVVQWVYTYASLGRLDGDYANRDLIARFMLERYPDIEAAREKEAASN